MTALPSWLLDLGGSAELLAKVTLVLLGAALAARRLRRRNAAARHVAWQAGLVAALALPFVQLVVPPARVPLPIVAREAPAPERAGGASRAPATSASPARAAGAVSPLRPAAARTPRLTPAGALLGLWILGSIVMIARLLTSLVRAGLLARRARPVAGLAPGANVRLRESDRVAVPMTFGALRPIVLVPRGFAAWDDTRRDDVLRHELAHVRRGDWLSHVAAQVALAAFWFHPLAHLASRRLRDEAEQAADDLVLVAGTRPSAYASHLVDLVRGLGPSHRSEAMTVSMIGGPFDSRIRAILDASRARGPATPRLRAALVAAAAASVLLLSAVDVAAEPAPPTPWEHLKNAWRAHVDWATTPDDGPEWFERGMQLHRDGEYEKAIDAFRRAVELESRVGVASYNVACGMARLGRTDEAFAWLKRAEDAGAELGAYLRTDADLASLRQDRRFAELAARHGDAERRAEAERAYAGLRSRSEEDGDEWARAALELQRAGAADAASDALKRAAELHARSSVTLYDLACANALEGRRDEALRAFEMAVAAGWSDADHARRDEDLESLRGDERFEKLLDDAALLQTSRNVTVFGWDVVAAPQDWRDAAERHAEFVAAHPESGTGWFQLGFARLRSGDAEGALAAYEKARELGYRTEVAAYNVACCHAVAGRTDAAFEWLARAASEGFDVAGQAPGDEDLDSLRGDERFRPYEGQARRMFRRLVAY